MFSPTARRALSHSLIRQSASPASTSTPASRMEKMILEVPPALDFSGLIAAQQRSSGSLEGNSTRKWIAGEGKRPPQVKREGDGNGPRRAPGADGARGERPDMRYRTTGGKSSPSTWQPNKTSGLTRATSGRTGTGANSRPRNGDGDNSVAARFNPSSPEFNTATSALPTQSNTARSARDGPRGAQRERAQRPSRDGALERGDRPVYTRNATSTDGATSFDRPSRSTQPSSAATSTFTPPQSKRDSSPTRSAAKSAKPTYATPSSLQLDSTRSRGPTTMDLFGFDDAAESNETGLTSVMSGGGEEGLVGKESEKEGSLSRRDKKAVVSLNNTLRKSGDFAPYIPSIPSTSSTPSLIKDLSSFPHVQSHLASSSSSTTRQLTITPPSPASTSSPGQIKNMAAFHADWSLARSGVVGGVGRKERLGVVGEMRRRLGLVA